MILWPIEYFLVRKKVSRAFFIWSNIISSFRRMRWFPLHAFSYCAFFHSAQSENTLVKIFLISRFSISSFIQCLFSSHAFSYDAYLAYLHPLPSPTALIFTNRKFFLHFCALEHRKEEQDKIIERGGPCQMLRQTGTQRVCRKAVLPKFISRFAGKRNFCPALAAL